MLVFLIQAYSIINLSLKNEYTKNLIELMRYEDKIGEDFIKNGDFEEFLQYRFAIFDENDRKIVSNLPFLPRDLEFVSLQQDGYIFYKDSFFANGKNFYTIVCKKQSDIGHIFATISILCLCFVVILSTLYFAFANSIKPCMNAKKYMNNFFNDAMHELKTPLGVIGINLQLLGSQNKYTARIESALKQMQITYDDVEYYIKHSYIIFKPEILDISDISHQRARYMRGFAMSKNVKIYDFIEPNLQVFINKAELIRIIDNNLSNAIKYSNESSIINIKLFKKDDFIFLQIEDFGNGIKDTSKIWKRYVRDDGVQGGFGLGLNMVQSICHKNGIKYCVSSQLGKGSIFTYKFKPFSPKILD